MFYNNHHCISTCRFGSFLEYSREIKPLNKTLYVDEEISECIKKAEHVARWFVSAGKVENIYVCLGVRP